MIHLLDGKSMQGLVEEGKVVKVGQRRLCPEEALSLIKEKVRLKRSVMSLKLSDTSDLFKVELAAHHTIPTKLVITITSKAVDSTKYEEAKRLLENQPIAKLLEENCLVKAQ